MANHIQNVKRNYMFIKDIIEARQHVLTPLKLSYIVFWPLPVPISPLDAKIGLIHVNDRSLWLKTCSHLIWEV